MKRILLVIYFIIYSFTLASWTNYRVLDENKNKTQTIRAISFGYRGNISVQDETNSVMDIKIKEMIISPNLKPEEVRDYMLELFEENKRLAKEYREGKTRTENSSKEEIKISLKIDSNKPIEMITTESFDKKIQIYINYTENGEIKYGQSKEEEKKVKLLIKQMKSGKRLSIKMYRGINRKFDKEPYYREDFSLDGFKKAYDNVKEEVDPYLVKEFYSNGRIKYYSDGPIEVSYENKAINFEELNEYYKEVKSLVDESIKNGSNDYIWQLQEGIEPEIYGLLLSKNLTLEERMELLELQRKVDELSKNKNY